MSINLYKKRTKNGQPVLEELLSKDSTTVADKPLVYDSTNNNVKSTNDLNVNSVTASCFHGPLDGTAKNATCFNNKTYAEACADILSGCAADSNKLNGKTYSEVCADILSGTAANSTCFAGKTCTEWKEIIKTTCVDNAALATNATCFNGCTYAQACADIRDGLATQTCADAIQACADFIQCCVTAIESKIPDQASASNQLADKDFVNSSITTNTANFRGTYACVAELPSTGNTNNDYAFVCSLNTCTGNYIYDRYKWVASDSCWFCEYELNTTGFTAEQLASINSGITSSLVAKITDVYDNTVTVCMNGECKGSFNLNQNTDVCIDLGDTIRNACCAGYATCAAQASAATNATCFDGCTYACAKEDIRNGMAAAISIGDSCPYQADGNRVVHIPAYPPDLSSCDGLDCTGTVTQIKVGITAYDPVSGIVSLPEYPTIPTTVCTAECANTVKRNVADCSGSCHLALFDGNTAVNDASLYVSNSKTITYSPVTGCLSTCCVRGVSGLIAGNPIGCSSTVLGQAGTYVSSGSLELYTTCPSIDFHVNNATADCTQRIIASCGLLRAIVNNGTGCTAATESKIFDFCSNGTFSGATNICGTNIYQSGNKVIDTSSTAQTKAGDICIGAPAACTPTSAGGTGNILGSTGIDIYGSTSLPHIHFHNNKYCGEFSARIASTTGRVALTVNNGTGCTAATQSKIFEFCSNGTFTGASTICASTNIYSAGCPVVTTGTLPTVAPGYNCTGTSNYVVTTKVCCAEKADCIVPISSERTDPSLGICALTFFGSNTYCGRPIVDDAYWFNYLTMSHGCGNTYYATQIAMPFTGSAYHNYYRQNRDGTWTYWYQLIDSTGGQTINGNLTIPTACGSFCGNLCGSAACVGRIATNCNSTYYLALHSYCDSNPNAQVYVSNGCPISYNPSTGILTACCINTKCGPVMATKSYIVAETLGFTVGCTYTLQETLEAINKCIGYHPGAYTFTSTNSLQFCISAPDSPTMYAYNYVFEKLDCQNTIGSPWRDGHWRAYNCAGCEWSILDRVSNTADEHTYTVCKTSRVSNLVCNVPSTASTTRNVIITAGCCNTTAATNYTWCFCGCNGVFRSPSDIYIGTGSDGTNTMYSMIKNGGIELSSSAPALDFHFNCYCGNFSSRLINNAQGQAQLIVNNGTGTTAATQTGTYTFCSDGTVLGICTGIMNTVCTACINGFNAATNNYASLKFQATCCDATTRCNWNMCLCGCNGKLYNPQGFMVGSCPVALVCDIPYDSSTGTLCSNIVKLGDHNYIYSGVNTGETWNGEMQISNFDGFTICAKHPTCVSSSCNWPYAVACGNVTSLGVRARAASCSVAIGKSACAACVGSIAIGTCAISELDNGLAIGHGAKTEVVKKAGMNEKFGCILSDIHRGEFRDVAIAVHGLPYMKNCDFYNALSCRIQLSKDIATCCTYTIGCANCSLLVRGWCQNKPIKAIKHTVCANYCMITLIQENSESYIYSCSNSGISFPIYIEVTGLSV